MKSSFKIINDEIIKNVNFINGGFELILSVEFFNDCFEANLQH